jgi:DNA invertase Pin-like site-specific DNA recombinase
LFLSKFLIAQSKDTNVRSFGLSSEIERQLISQRTKEALARIRAEGNHVGRPHGSKSKKNKFTMQKSLAKKLLEQKMPKKKIAEQLGMHRSTLVKYLD